MKLAVYNSPIHGFMVPTEQLFHMFYCFRRDILTPKNKKLPTRGRSTYEIKAISELHESETVCQSWKIHNSARTTYLFQ